MIKNTALSHHDDMKLDSLSHEVATEERAIKNSWTRCKDVGLIPTGKPIDAVTSDINFVAPSSHEIILTFDLFTNKRTLRSPRYF